MYVVATPLFAALLLRTRIGALTWFAVALATAGLGVLTLDGFAIGYGEALTLVAALLYALHIVGLGAWSKPDEALGMSILQLFVIAVICLVATAPDGIVLPDDARDWLSVLYMAVFAGALALVAQTWAQAHLAPTRTAIIMSMEPVFAALFAVWLGGESAGVGCYRRRDGAHRDAPRRARPPPQDRGRSPAPRGLGPVRTQGLAPRADPSAELNSTRLARDGCLHGCTVGHRRDRDHHRGPHRLAGLGWQRVTDVAGPVQLGTQPPVDRAAASQRG